MADEAFKEGSNLRQEVGDGSESTIEINIKTLDSRIYKFRVNKDMPVPVLKDKIVDATGVPVDQQRLIFRGKVLKDDHLLSEYHVEDGHTLHLVARQPVQSQHTPGTASGESTPNNGNDSTGSALPNRAGQVAHGIVVGSVNIADNGEAIVADIARGVGELLRSLGVGSIAPPGGVSNNSSPTIPPNAETEGARNVSNRAQLGNMVQPGFAILNHPAQISQFRPAGTLSRHMVIPDSLTTLLDFIGRMDLALQNNGSQSSTLTNIQFPPRTEDASLQFRGPPTPQLLGSVIERARLLLSGNATSALSHIAQRLEREALSTDTAVRNQIQSEAMHLGVAMQHLGAMLLELGRTTMTLRMGQSPAESFVNAGPSVYISATGPNPIMVQPFPLQTSSLFGASTAPIVNGVSGQLGGGDPSRNINIHIHAGSSAASGVASADTRTNSGNVGHGEQPIVEQVFQNVNNSGDSNSMRGLPPRTILTAIPGRSPSETASHVLNVMYPVSVRSQSSLPNQSASSQGSHPTVSSGFVPILAPQTSSGASGLSAVVAQISARVSSALSGNERGQPFSSLSSQNSEVQGSHPDANNEVQRTSLVTSTSAQIGSELLSTTEGQCSSSSSMQSYITPFTSSTESLPVNKVELDLSSQDNSVGGINNVSRDDSAQTVASVNMKECENQIQQRGPGFSPSLGYNGPSDLVGSLTTSLAGNSKNCQPCAASSSSVDKSGEQNPESDGEMRASRSSRNVESDKPPLGLGLGGLQSKKRGKPAKPTSSNVSRDTSLVNQNQQSITKGQQVLQTLVSQSSDANGIDSHGSSTPVSSIGQVLEGMSLGGRGAQGQIDFNSMLSNVLQTPAFNSLLTNVAEQTGVGSPSDLRNMMEQCTQIPAMRNTLNNIVQQVEGQDQDLGSMIPGLGRGGGGIDFSRMVQQMMPVVSQALGRGLARPTTVNGLQSGTQTQAGGTRGADVSHDRNAQIDLHQARERIEQHDTPGNIFEAVLEGADSLHGEDNSFQDLVEELSCNTDLANDYMNFLRRQVYQRVQSGSNSKT
ncbi:uncharacterized protein [Typha angustifolia]|uniref:uncharacterized protein n=1 Tax=Typha angustifolia TaxID=59011 RepID=UPI003C2E4918